jgi:hypothetical protein
MNKIFKTILTIVLVTNTLVAFSQTDNDKYKLRFDKAVQTKDINACEEYLTFYQYDTTHYEDVAMIKQILREQLFKKGDTLRKQENFIAASETYSNSLKYCQDNKCIKKVSKKLKKVNIASNNYLQIFNHIDLNINFGMVNMLYHDLYDNDLKYFKDEYIDLEDDIRLGGGISIGDKFLFQRGNGALKIFGAGITANYLYAKEVPNMQLKLNLYLTSIISPFIRYNVISSFNYKFEDYDDLYFYRQSQNGVVDYGIETLIPLSNNIHLGFSYATSSYEGTTVLARKCEPFVNDCIKNIDEITKTDSKMYEVSFVKLLGDDEGAIMTVIMTYGLKVYDINDLSGTNLLRVKNGYFMATFRFGFRQYVK